MSLLAIVLFVALLAHAIAHVTIAIMFLRERTWKRAALAFVLPPLAPLWAWRAGMRALVYVWTGALAVYALGVAVA